jgi:SAM-dependent methyltransferase
VRGVLGIWPGLRPCAAAAFWLLRPLTGLLTLSVFRDYPAYLRDLRAYRALPQAEPIVIGDLRPSLGDRGKFTPVDGTYFQQDTWAARKILGRRPEVHLDAGSSALLVGILAQALPVISADIRPLPYGVPGLRRIAGDVTRLPFSDCSVPSISSLCVIEHIGLGRYGDELEPQGSVKAARELTRVLGEGGDLLISVPVGRSSVNFNAFRSFAVEQVIEMFGGLRVEELVFVQGGRIVDADAAIAAGPLEPVVVGLFHFRKSAEAAERA